MIPTLIFRWLGTAGFELSIRGQTLVVDPYFTRIPFWRQWIGRVESDVILARQKVPRADYILITHPHFDHILDVPAIANFTGALVFGSRHTCRLLKSCGVRDEQIIEIETGSHLLLGDFQIEVFPATHGEVPGFGPGPLPRKLHPPLHARDYRLDVCFTFSIDVGGFTLLTNPYEYPIPLAPVDFLLVSPLFPEEYFQNLLSDVRPQLVIPNHWDDFWRPLSRPIRPILDPSSAFPPLQRVDLRIFQREIEKIDPETRVLFPEIFRSYLLSDMISGLRKFSFE